MAGWVYIISNKAMPGILKIGYTERTPYIRAYELYHTGCPYPYQVDYSIYVDKPYEVEQKTHELQRNTNVGKEWFSCSHNEAISSIQESIKLVNASVETNRKAPELTEEEIDKIIKDNPAIKEIIRTEQFKSKLSVRVENEVIQFNSNSYKNRFEEGLFRIDNEISNKVNLLRKDYNDIVNGKKKKSILEHMYYFYVFTGFPYLFLMVYIRDNKGWMQSEFESYWVDFAIIYFILAVVYIIITVCKENRKITKYKNEGFCATYKEKIEEFNKEKKQKIFHLKNDFKNYYRIVK